MIVDVIGVQKVNFTNKEGDVIKGTNIFVSYPDPNVIGVKCDKFFVKNSIDCSSVDVNSQIELLFNRYGKVDSLSII